MIEVPAGLIESYDGAAGRTFVASLPGLAADLCERWGLRLDGVAMHGACALVLPVVGPGGVRTVLKLQRVDDENVGEPLALRTWDGDGAVRLLEHDPATGSMLLERLDPSRSLASEPDVHRAVVVIAELLAHLSATPAPATLRTLAAVAPAMLEQAPELLATVADPADRQLLADGAAALAEVAPEPGDRLLHWDLHYNNVLASDRAPWLAIDPKPLAGDPGFELLPALANRFDADDVEWRFDARTEILGLDRDRASAWTLGRVLQSSLWDLKDGQPPDPVRLEVARRLRRAPPVRSGHGLDP